MTGSAASSVVRFAEKRTGEPEPAVTADLGNSALGEIGKVDHTPRTDFRPHHRDAPRDQLFRAVGIAGILETLPLSMLAARNVLQAFSS